MTSRRPVGQRAPGTPIAWCRALERWVRALRTTPLRQIQSPTQVVFAQPLGATQVPARAIGSQQRSRVRKAGDAEQESGSDDQRPPQAVAAQAHDAVCAPRRQSFKASALRAAARERPECCCPESPRRRQTTASASFEQGLQLLQVFAVGAAHGACHERRGELGEAARRAAVRNCATKAMRDPTRNGGDVSHSTALMLTYQLGAFDGSTAYAATSARGRAMTMSVVTSTPMKIPARSRMTPAPEHEPSLSRRSLATAPVAGAEARDASHLS